MKKNRIFRLFLTLVVLWGACKKPNDAQSNIAADVPIVINEFMASNKTDTIVDEYGRSADWIELYNNSDTMFNLKGLCISDDSTNLLKFALEDTLIPGRGYYLIWADNDEEEGPNHANFKLDKDIGEVIVLSTADELIANKTDSYKPEARIPNVSYGRIEDGSSIWDRQSIPTPNTKNSGR